MKNIVRKTRRPNGEGCIYYCNGYWCCKKWITENRIKKRKTIYAKTKIELMKKYIEQFGQTIQNEILENDFCDSMLFWILNVKKLYVSSRTISGNISTFRNYIKPFFTNKRISQIGSEIIILYFNHLLDKGISKNCFYKCKFLISQFFRYMEQQNNLIKYPFILYNIKYKGIINSINNYKAIPKDIRKEFLKLLEKNKLIKIVCYLGMFAGLRIGEILALKWENVVLDDKVIKVRNSLSTKLNFDNSGQITKTISVLGSTKTECSLRDIPIPNILYKTLLEWHNETILLSKLKNKSKPIYVLGKQIPRAYTSVNKSFRRFLKRTGFDKNNIHFHSMRHTYATMLLEKNVNPKIVQFLLGHRSVKTTLEIYNNVEYVNKTLLTIINDALFHS